VARGRLITIEGVDGSGKTTLAAGLADALRARGIEARVLREPGGVEVAERIRKLVHDPALRIGPRTEALLFAAARAQLVEEALEPLLEAGTWVVLDRFVDSSLAYQGGGRALRIEEIAEINRFATRGLAPDRTLLLTLAPELGRARARAREAVIDRLEREHDEFFSGVAEAYRQLAAREPGRIRSLDASEPPERVLGAALAELSDLFLPEARERHR
jgi:dTMP kinase